MANIAEAVDFPSQNDPPPNAGSIKLPYNYLPVSSKRLVASLAT